MKSVLRNVLVSLATVVGTCIRLAGAASADPPQGMRLCVLVRLAHSRQIRIADWSHREDYSPGCLLPFAAGTRASAARFTGGLADGVVAAQHGWWQACALDLPGYDPLGSDGANINLVIGNESFDPVSGAAPHRSYCCRAERLTDAPAAE